MAIELGQVDPSVKVPAAVRAAAQRAEDMIKQSIPPTEEVTEVPAPEIEKIVEGVTEGVKQDPPKKETRDESGDEHPDDTWKSKYLSMKGRFERAQQQMTSMSDSIAAMQRAIAELKDKADAPAPKQRERLLTPEEETEYGEEFLNVVGKKAKEELFSEFDEMRQELNRLKNKYEKVTESQTQNARTTLFNTLDEKCPQWRDLNENESFITWLRLPDTYSGDIRHELLNAAFEKNETSRVLAFFNGFLAEEAAVAPARTREAEFSGAAAPQDKLSLEEFAAPGRAKTAAASAPTEKPYFTRAQVSQFYAAVTAGRYRGKEAEKDRLEAQIFDAQREGRIR